LNFQKSQKKKNFLYDLDLLEKEYILKALEICKGNRTHAAKMLGISVRTLRNKLNEYNVGSSFGEDAEEIKEQ
jgi:two-component system response regulator FlrC